MSVSLDVQQFIKKKCAITGSIHILDFQDNISCGKIFYFILFFVEKKNRLDKYLCSDLEGKLIIYLIFSLIISLFRLNLTMSACLTIKLNYIQGCKECHAFIA